MVNVAAALELLWKDECDIIEYEAVKNPVTKITKHQEVSKVVNQKCRLSFPNTKSVKQTDSGASVDFVAKVFMAADVVVKSGSKVIVTRLGRTYEFTCSGEPAVYESHQEIMLDLFKGWS